MQPCQRLFFSTPPPPGSGSLFQKPQSGDWSLCNMSAEGEGQHLTIKAVYTMCTPRVHYIDLSQNASN